MSIVFVTLLEITTLIFCSAAAWRTWVTVQEPKNSRCVWE